MEPILIFRVDAVTTGSWTSLMFAAAHNHVSYQNTLFQTSFSRMDKHKVFCLQVAVVQILLEKGADKTLKNRY